MVNLQAQKRVLPRRGADKVGVGQVQRVAQQVAVRVNQAWVHCGALHVLDLSSSVGIQNFMLLSDGHDLALVHSHRLGLGAIAV